MESPNELSVHKKWRGYLPLMESPGKIGVKVVGSKLDKVSLGYVRGFKILPNNDSKMLLYRL
jgi:hypothetical protein